MKKIVFIIVPVLIIVILGVGTYMFFKNRSESFGTFNLQDDIYYIEKFPSEIVLGPVNTAKEAREKAELVWSEKWECAKTHKPYNVFYDEENKVWYVQGSLPKRMVGGLPNIIIRQSDGKVLALWHNKG